MENLTGYRMTHVSLFIALLSFSTPSVAKLSCIDLFPIEVRASQPVVEDSNKFKEIVTSDNLTDAEAIQILVESGLYRTKRELNAAIDKYISAIGHFGSATTQAMRKKGLEFDFYLRKVGDPLE